VCNTEHLKTHLKSKIWLKLGIAKGPFPPKFLENKVIFCFQRRFSKQNSVTRLKSNILPPKKNFGLATPLGEAHFTELSVRSAKSPG